VFRLRRCLLDAEHWVEDGGLLVLRGRVHRVLCSRAAVRRAGARVLDLGHGIVTAGLVNAHAHLELSGLAGLLPAARGFAAWVGDLLRARAARGPEALERDAAAGAQRLLLTGTTTVGDIDTTGAGLRAARAGAGPRRVLYREVLDAFDPARRRSALASVRRGWRARADLSEGLSPHAPFTASPELLRGVARIACARRLPVAIHWSESAEELLWLERGAGPFAALLPASPKRRGLDAIREAGLLGPRTALIHGNLPRRGEPALLAEAGATLVHCPGTHAFFGREAFPWARYRRAGVRLALGTDSLASNLDLDLRRELSLARDAAPELPPARLWRMATENGAAALGLAGAVGTLRAGACADLAWFAAEPRSLRAALEVLTAGEPDVLGVWLGGRAPLNAKFAQGRLS
jgi:cytosine/adenosine deaminase-related metal-dependent hydrolase